MLKYNGTILKVNNGASVIGSVTPSPTYTVIYENKNTITNTYAQVDNMPWNDYPYILIQRSWQYSGSDGVCAIDNSSGNWRFHIRKYNSYLPSDKFGVEQGGWGASCSIDNSGVTTTYFWSTNWYVIPVNPASYLTDKIIIKPSETYLSYYVNGTLMIHRTNFSDFLTSIRFRSTNVNIKDMYVVGCPDLQTAVDFTP